MDCQAFISTGHILLITPKIAIIGSGPTGIYTLKGLIGKSEPLAITVF